MTREQIGRALDYTVPLTAITKIHTRNKERLDMFSVTTKLVGTDGKLYDTYIYNAKGIYEICRWSRQPKANAFFDWVYEVLENLRKGKTVLVQNVPPQPMEPTVTEIERAKVLIDVADKFKRHLPNKSVQIIVEEAVGLLGVKIPASIEDDIISPPKQPATSTRKLSSITTERRSIGGYSLDDIGHMIGKDSKFVNTLATKYGLYALKFGSYSKAGIHRDPHKRPFYFNEKGKEVLMALFQQEQSK
ncbi:hypothetical protein HUB94_02555 (plasmid) [Paenibacillus cellulosilyticus]|nr:hypothetical protein HUB94_02555 [Paenibacillus cellulosilyticus]